VTYSIDGSSTATGCSVTSAGLVSAGSSGQCVVNVNQAGNADWYAAVQVQITETFTSPNQTIHQPIAPTGAWTQGLSVYTTASSGLSVSYRLIDQELTVTCSVSASGVVTSLSFGQCMIEISQAGNDNYNAAAPIDVVVFFGAASQSITAPSNPAAVSWLSSVDVSTTATSPLGVVYTIDPSSTAANCSVGYYDGIVTASSIGICVVNENQAGNSNYTAAAQVQVTVTFTLLSQTITRPSVPSGPWSAYHSVNTYSTSGIAVTYSIDGSSTAFNCRVDGDGNVSAGSAGTCVVNINQAGDAAYAAAAQVQVVAIFTPATQTIAAPSGPSGTWQQSLSVATTSDSSLSVSYVIVAANSTALGCSVSSAGLVTASSPGVCEVAISQTGNANYLAASTVYVYAAFNRLGQNITVPSGPGYPTAPWTQGISVYTTSTSGLSVTYSVGNGSTANGCAVTSSGIVTASSVGFCVIWIDQAGNAYFAAAATQIVYPTFIRINQSIAAPSGLSAPWNQSLSVIATTTSGLYVNYNLDYSSSGTGCSLDVVSGVVTRTSPGTCLIDINQGGDGQYNAAGLVEITVTFTKLQQSIYTPSLRASPWPGLQPIFAGASSGYQVSYTLVGGSAVGCQLGSGPVVQAASAGTCVVLLSQAGDSYYAPANSLLVTVIFTARDQWISALPDPASVPWTQSVNVLRSSSSNLAVTYSIDGISTASGCVVTSAGVVTARSWGTCVVNVNQAGDANYTAAPQVQVNVSFNAADQTIAPPSAPSGPWTQGLSVYTTASSGLGVSYSVWGSSAANCVVNSAGMVYATSQGTCVISIDSAGNGTYGNAPTIQVTVTFTLANQHITVPNTPAMLAWTQSVNVATYASSGEAVSYILDGASASGCQLDGFGNVWSSGPGTCVIDINQGGNDQYSAAAQVTVTVTFTLASQSIALSGTQGAWYTGGYSVSADSFLGNPRGVSFSASGVCSVGRTSGSITVYGSGSCTVTATIAADALYAKASNSITLVYTLTYQNIYLGTTGDGIWNTGGYRVYGYGGYGSGAISYEVVSSGYICSVNKDGFLSIYGAGLCTVQVTISADGYYASATASTTLTFTPSSQTILQRNPDEGGWNTSTDVSSVSTSGLEVDYSVDWTSTADCSVSNRGIVTARSSGRCVIDLNQVGNANFLPAPLVHVIVTLDAISQSITVPNAPPAQQWSLGSQSVASSATSGLDVTYVIDGLSAAQACYVDESGLVTAASPGVCLVIISQSGNSGYLPAPTAEIMVTFTASQQTITVPNPTTVAWTSSQSVATTATSGGTVSYSIGWGSSATGCSVTSSGIVSATSSGICNVLFSQIGDANFYAADTVWLSVTFSATSQTIHVPATPVSVAWSSSESVATSATSGAAVTYSIASATATGCAVSSSGIVTAGSAGTCVVQINQSGNANYLAASPILVTATFLALPPPAIAPSAPIHLSVQVKGSQITVRWNAPRTSGSAAVYRYIVTFQPGGRRYAVSGRTWILRIKGFSTKVRYTISVIAVSSAGKSPAIVLRNVLG
jgi:hypothetical protein